VVEQRFCGVARRFENDTNLSLDCDLARWCGGVAKPPTRAYGGVQRRPFVRSDLHRARRFKALGRMKAWAR